ncbi:MAG: hypothetical protein Q8L81_17720 [Bacteroidota bacterium]|nr:hypothetical protein [Bacteroidota bacterium]
MKKILKITILFFLGSIILVINGCKKTGPQGPAGPAGKDSPVNVYSTTFTMSSWSYTSPYYYRNLSVPELTSNNVDSSLVMVYFSTGGSNWFALPYTQYNSPVNYYMGFVSSVGNVQVTWVYNSSLSTGSDPNSYYGTTITCKAVVIPPARIKPGVNHQNYDDVKVAYGL